MSTYSRKDIARAAGATPRQAELLFEAGVLSADIGEVRKRCSEHEAILGVVALTALVAGDSPESLRDPIAWLRRATTPPEGVPFETQPLIEWYMNHTITGALALEKDDEKHWEFAAAEIMHLTEGGGRDPHYVDAFLRLKSSFLLPLDYGDERLRDPGVEEQALRNRERSKAKYDHYMAEARRIVRESNEGVPAGVYHAGHRSLLLLSARNKRREAFFSFGFDGEIGRADFGPRPGNLSELPCVREINVEAVFENGPGL